MGIKCVKNQNPIVVEKELLPLIALQTQAVAKVSANPADEIFVLGLVRILIAVDLEHPMFACLVLMSAV